MNSGGNLSLEILPLNPATLVIADDAPTLLQLRALHYIVNGGAGDLAALGTTDKSNLVAAINEVLGHFVTITDQQSAEIVALQAAVTDLLARIDVLEDAQPHPTQFDFRVPRNAQLVTLFH